MDKDMVYRQDAIDAVAELVSSMSVCISVDECHGMKRMQGMAVRALEQLPPAQPEPCEDAVSREAAINALDEIESEIANGYGYQYPKWRKYFCELPSAQPEIIRCKDCKHYVNIRRTNRFWCDTDDGIGGENPEPDDFCSRAERRTDE